MLLLTESLITFKGEFVIFAAKFKDDSLLLKEILLSHNGEFVSIKGWKNNGWNVVFNRRIVIEPLWRSGEPLHQEEEREGEVVDPWVRM